VLITEPSALCIGLPRVNWYLYAVPKNTVSNFYNVIVVMLLTIDLSAWSINFDKAENLNDAPNTLSVFAYYEIDPVTRDLRSPSGLFVLTGL